MSEGSDLLAATGAYTGAYSPDNGYLLLAYTSEVALFKVCRDSACASCDEAGNCLTCTTSDPPRSGPPLCACPAGYIDNEVDA